MSTPIRGGFRRRPCYRRAGMVSCKDERGGMRVQFASLGQTNVPSRKRSEYIIVLKGGDSPEREVSLRSGAAVEEALKEKGFRVSSLDSRRNFLKPLLKEKPYCVFIALHGGAGEDGTIQAFLETLKIPYTGSPPLASSLAMNKLFAKKIFLYHRLPTPKFYPLEKNDIVPPLFFPAVVKPVNLGSTLGVFIVERKKDLAGAIKRARGFGSPIFIEKYVKGKEVTVSILGNRNPVILPTIQIIAKKGFYNYHAKYTPGESFHLIPPKMPERSVRRAESIALKAHQVLGCRGFSRTEIIIDRKGNPWLLDVNTIPGLTKISLFPDAAKAAGISFSDLCAKLIELGIEEFKNKNIKRK